MSFLCTLVIERRIYMCVDRYYYAIVECDSVQAASHIYSELEGTELERSANVFDLSFVPDDMTFDEECRYVARPWTSYLLLTGEFTATKPPMI